MNDFPHVGQVVHVYKARESEPYAGIVVNVIGDMPTIFILPKNRDGIATIIDMVPRRTESWSANGWEPIP